MRTLILILCAIWFVVLIMFLIAYVLFLEHELNLSRWRKSLQPDMKIFIDDGSMNYTGTIVSVTESGWIRVMNDSGKITSHGVKCTYPINEIL